MRVYFIATIYNNKSYRPKYRPISKFIYVYKKALNLAKLRAFEWWACTDLNRGQRDYEEQKPKIMHFLS